MSELIIGYSLIILAPITLLYLLLVFFEYTRDNQFASDTRLYLDEQLLVFLEVVVQQTRKVTKLYRSSNHAVKEELLDPFAEPFITTKEHYTTLKTGRKSLAGRSTKRLSPHLKKLIRNQ